MPVRRRLCLWTEDFAGLPLYIAPPESGPIQTKTGHLFKDVRPFNTTTNRKYNSIKTKMSL